MSDTQGELPLPTPVDDRLVTELADRIDDLSWTEGSKLLVGTRERYGYDMAMAVDVEIWARGLGRFLAPDRG